MLKTTLLVIMVVFNAQSKESTLKASRAECPDVLSVQKALSKGIDNEYRIGIQEKKWEVSLEPLVREDQIPEMTTRLKGLELKDLRIVRESVVTREKKGFGNHTSENLICNYADTNHHHITLSQREKVSGKKSLSLCQVFDKGGNILEKTNIAEGNGERVILTQSQTGSVLVKCE